VKVFSPIGDNIKEQQHEKVLLDFLQGAIFLLVAPSFHSALSHIKWVKDNPNWMASLIDVTYG